MELTRPYSHLDATYAADMEFETYLLIHTRFHDFALIIRIRTGIN